MKPGLIAAVVSALLVSGCGMFNCGADTNNRSASGSCGAHTTFFSSVAEKRPASFTKS